MDSTCSHAFLAELPPNFYSVKWNLRLGLSGSNRVNRGGSWNNTPVNLRSANRNNNTPSNRNNNLGFRCVSPKHPLTR